jgi:hypothetical protein
MWFEGALYNVLSQYADDVLYKEFDELVEILGFHWQNRDGVTLGFYAADQDQSAAFANYAQWQWLCGLIKQDCSDVYEEIYSCFAASPEKLNRLDWRQFEILLFRIFQNHGFQAQLGPGRGDDGIDVRFLQRDPLGDILTLVQAKKYAPSRKIKLEAVQALHGAADIEGADRTIFVTTSSYEPVARRWAARTSGRMRLATSADVAEWCAKAAETVIRDKSSLVDPDHVHRILANSQGIERHRIVHAKIGFTMDLNQFALVIKETTHAALLMKLPSIVLKHDGYMQRGLEAPITDLTAMSNFNSSSVWRVKKNTRDNRTNYWDGKHLYSRWNGEPDSFDMCD